MRRVRLIALMISLCAVLSACSGGAKTADRAEELQEEYAKAEDYNVTAHITADYGDRVYEFRLSFTGDPQSGTVEVLEPEEIAGLTAKLTEDGARLVYDGAELSIGSLTPGGLSPMEALPVMIGQWQSGRIASADFERFRDTDTLAVRYSITDDEQLVTWFDCETGLPIRAELMFDGAMVVGCDFESITI